MYEMKHSTISWHTIQKGPSIFRYSKALKKLRTYTTEIEILGVDIRSSVLKSEPKYLNCSVVYCYVSFTTSSHIGSTFPSFEETNIALL